MRALLVSPAAPVAVRSGRGDRAILAAAAAVAVLLHVAASFLPLPATHREPPPPPARSSPPRIDRSAPPPPPPPPVAEPRPRSSVRRMLLPMLVEPDRVAVPEPEAPAVDSPSPLRVEPLLDDGAAPPPAPAVYEAGQAELIPPRALPGRREPDYPPTARRLRAEGTVVLRAVITVEGAVDEVEVVRAPEPDWGMVEAAMAAVAAWRYEPGMLRGRPVAVRMTVMVEFELH